MTTDLLRCVSCGQPKPIDRFPRRTAATTARPMCGRCRALRAQRKRFSVALHEATLAGAPRNLTRSLGTTAFDLMQALLTSPEGPVAALAQQLANGLLALDVAQPAQRRVAEIGIEYVGYVVARAGGGGTRRRRGGRRGRNRA